MQCIGAMYFSRIMRRDKFQHIRKLLHFTDQLSEDPADSLAKLRGFLEKIGNFFVTITPQIKIFQSTSIYRFGKEG